MRCKAGDTEQIAKRLEAMSSQMASGCRLWNHYTSAKGYGRIWLDGRLRQAHRVAYEAAKGPIPDGYQVLHRCDTPGCINPAHLVAGTNVQNHQDKVAKGRQPRGERVGVSKLTDEKVRAIRRDPRINADVARAYGVSPSCISEIRSGKQWTHVRDQDGVDETLRELEKVS